MSYTVKFEALGPFDKELAGHMEYPAGCYEDVPHGAMVMTSLLDLETQDPSLDLLACLGRKRGDMGNLVMTADEVRRSMVEHGGDWDCFLSRFGQEESNALLAAMRAMMDRGFVFVIRPCF